MTYVVTLLCVMGIAAGQILFKTTASNANGPGGLLSSAALVPLTAALVLYGITTLAWVWVLQRAELGRIYPFMALAFVVVPLGSAFFFGEQFRPAYFIGVAFVVVGIAISTGS